MQEVFDGQRFLDLFVPSLIVISVATLSINALPIRLYARRSPADRGIHLAGDRMFVYNFTPPLHLRIHPLIVSSRLALWYTAVCQACYLVMKEDLEYEY
jgi:hypothetical protein